VNDVGGHEPDQFSPGVTRGVNRKDFIEPKASGREMPQASAEKNQQRNGEEYVLR
jgi:hypothetical protein